MLEEKLAIKFKALCSLKRFNEAIAILPDMLFYNKHTVSEQNFKQFLAEITESFPDVAKQIHALASMLDTMYSIFL